MDTFPGSYLDLCPINQTTQMFVNANDITLTSRTTGQIEQKVRILSANSKTAWLKINYEEVLKLNMTSNCQKTEDCLSSKAHLGRPCFSKCHMMAGY